MNKNVLIIGFVWPEPKSSAAGSRMLQIIDLFKSENYRITFATACAKSDNAFDLKKIGVNTETITLNHSSFDTFIKELNPDVVVFDRFMIEEQFGWRVAAHCPNALRVLDTEDLHCLRRGRQQALKDKAIFDSSYLFNDTAKREIASIYRSDVSLIISEVEMDLLKNQFNINDNLLCYLPFLVAKISEDTQKSWRDFQDRNHFFTIGNFLHKPNVDGLIYLKTKIWPLIRAKIPKAEMHVYGAYVSAQANQLHNKNEGFIIKGFAGDVNKTMQDYKVCLVPLRYGAGLKGKILDALLNGLPCVTTQIGAEGMFGSLAPNGFITDDPMDFADKAKALYTDETLWNQKQKLGLTIINSRFNKALHMDDFLNTIKTKQNTLKNHRQNNFIGNMLMHHTLQSTKFMSKWIEAKNA